MGKIVNINEERCQGCGVCADVCPQHILYVDKNSKTAAVTDERRCDRFRGCERVCPVGAIKIA